MRPAGFDSPVGLHALWDHAKRTAAAQAIFEIERHVLTFTPVEESVHPAARTVGAKTRTQRQSLPAHVQRRIGLQPARIRNRKANLSFGKAQLLALNTEAIQIFGQSKRSRSALRRLVDHRLVDRPARFHLRINRRVQILAGRRDVEQFARIHGASDSLPVHLLGRHAFLDIGHHHQGPGENLGIAPARGDRVLRRARLILPIVDQRIDHNERHNQRRPDQDCKE